MEFIIYIVVILIVSVVAAIIGKIKLNSALQKKDFIYVMYRIAASVINVPPKSVDNYILRSKKSIQFAVEELSIYAEHGDRDRIMLLDVFSFPMAYSGFVDSLRNMPLPAGVELNISVNDYNEINVNIIGNVNCTYNNDIFAEISSYFSSLISVKDRIIEEYGIYKNSHQPQQPANEYFTTSNLDAPISFLEDIEVENKKRKRRNLIRALVFVFAVQAAIIIPPIIIYHASEAYYYRTREFSVDLANGVTTSIYYKPGDRDNNYQNVYRVGDSETEYDDIYIYGISFYSDEVLPSEYEVDKNTKRIIWVTKDEKSGSVDATGKPLVPLIIPGEVTGQMRDYIFVSKHIKDSYIDEYGISHSTLGYTLEGVYSTEGKEIIPIKYKDIRFEPELDCFVATDGDGEHFFDPQWNPIEPEDHEKQ